MKVSDILRVKGGTLFTVAPTLALGEAVQTMADRDIGSLVVMEWGDLVGMLTFREVIGAFVKNGGLHDQPELSQRRPPGGPWLSSAE